MRPSERGKRVALVLAAGWLAAAQVGKIPPALPALREELALSLVQAGWIATSISSVTAILGVALGLFAARLGARHALAAGLALLALGGMVGLAAGSGATLIGSRVLEGVGFVLVIVSAPSLIALEMASEPERRRMLLVVWSSYLPVGIAVMMAVAPLLLERLGWRELWGVNAVLLGLCFALVTLRRGRTPAAAGGGEAGSPALKDGLLLPGPWIMGLCFACYSSIWLMIITWLPTYAVSVMGFSLRAAAWLTAVAVLGNIAGTLSAHFLLRRMSRWVIVAASLALIGSLGWGVFSSAWNPVARSAAALVACSLPGALPASILAGIPLHVRRPSQLAVANAVLMQCSHLGAFLGPPAIAALVTAFGGWESGRWLIPALATLGLGASLVLKGVEQRAASPAHAASLARARAYAAPPQTSGGDR